MLKENIKSVHMAGYLIYNVFYIQGYLIYNVFYIQGYPQAMRLQWFQYCNCYLLLFISVNHK